MNKCMKKRLSKVKLNRKKSHSDLELRNLLRSLVLNGQIETVSARAKKLKSYTARAISICLNSEENNVRRIVYSKYGDRVLAENLCAYADYIKGKESDRKSGFVSVIKTRFRDGDNSEMSEVSLLGFDDFVKSLESKKPVRKTKKKTVTTKKSKVKKPEKEEKKAEKAAKPVKKEKQEAKPKEKTPSEKLGAKKKDEGKPSIPQKKEGFLNRLRGRLLGRKVTGPNVGGGDRTRARSGL